MNTFSVIIAKCKKCKNELSAEDSSSDTFINACCKSKKSRKFCKTCFEKVFIEPENLSNLDPLLLCSKCSKKKAPKKSFLYDPQVSEILEAVKRIEEDLKKFK